MNKEQAVKAAKTYLRRLADDFPACRELMTDDFVWENFLPAQVPFGGRYEGMEGVKEYLHKLSKTWVIGKLELNDFIFDSETRVLAVKGVERNGKSLTTGRVCDMEFVWEFRFSEDHRLAYLREYNDTAAIGDAFSQQ